MNTSSAKDLSLPPMLRVFMAVSALMGCLALVVEWVCARWPGLNRVPYNCMTLGKDLDYVDFDMFRERFDHFHTASFFDKAWGSDFLYPAPDALIYRFFHFFPNDTNFFLSFVSLSFVCLTGWLYWELRRRGIRKASAAGFAIISLVFSYPAFFEFNRANVEMVVWGLTAGGVLLFVKNRPWLAAICLGLAGACKGYPYFYLGLFLVRKRYWETAASVALGGAVTAASFWLEAANFTVGRTETAAGVDLFRQFYVLRRRANEIGLDHSVFGLIKRFWESLPAPDRLQHYLTAYMVIAALLACAVFFFRVRKLPLINQVIFVTVTCITLPPTSYDYTLLHLYTPWLMVLFLIMRVWQEHGTTPKELWPVVICFTVLLSTQSEMIWRGERIEGQLKCLFLLLLAGLAAWRPMTPKMDVTDDHQEATA